MDELNDYIGNVIKYIEIKINTDFISNNDDVFVDEITLIFDDFEVLITPDIDTDEIILKKIMKRNLETAVIPNNIFDKYVNKKIQMIWKGINTQGYLDLLTFGFNQLKPDILILSEGSVLKIFKITSPLPR